MKPVCPAMLSIDGQSYTCDFIEKNMPPESKNHQGWAHSNFASGAIWTSDTPEEDLPPGDNPGEMLLYVIQIRCFLAEDGGEQDGIRIWKPGTDELPAYKEVLGSLAMAPRVVDHIYDVDGDVISDED